MGAIELRESSCAEINKSLKEVEKTKK